MVWIVVAMAVAACNADSTGPVGAGSPPELPPLTSMAVDFSFFGAGGAGSAALGPDATMVGPNFTTASLSVLVAQVVAVAVLAVPTATFAAALQAGATYDDGVWHWRTEATTQGGTWSAHLSGTIQGADALWEMRVTSPSSATPPLQDFLWYSGVSKLDGSSGVWRMYDPASGAEALRIDWTHASAEAHALTINVTDSGAVEAGNYLMYEVDGDLRTIRYFDASEGTTIEVGWNATTGEGYIIAPSYNGGDKSCWDSAQNNVACA